MWILGAMLKTRMLSKSGFAYQSEGPNTYSDNVPSWPGSITLDHLNFIQAFEFCLVLTMMTVTCLFVILKLSDTTFCLFDLGWIVKLVFLLIGMDWRCLEHSLSVCKSSLTVVNIYATTTTPCILFAGVQESPCISVRLSFYILRRVLTPYQHIWSG